MLLPLKCLLLLRKISIRHPVHPENSTVILNGAVNPKNWFSREMAVFVTKKELISTVNKTKLLQWA